MDIVMQAGCQAHVHHVVIVMGCGSRDVVIAMGCGLRDMVTKA